jgi:hypothetical protein
MFSNAGRVAEWGGLLNMKFNISRPKSWQEIAEQVQKETDPDKLTQLSQELIAAIDLQLAPPSRKKRRIVKLDSNSRKTSTDC